MSCPCRLAIATGRKRTSRGSGTTSSREENWEEDTASFIEEQQAQLEWADEAGDRPPRLVDGKTDRWVGMDFTEMSELQRQVFLENSIAVLAARDVEMAGSGEEQQEPIDWNQVADKMGSHLAAVDKVTGVPEWIIQQRQHQLVELLQGLGIGEDFKSKAKLASRAISALCHRTLDSKVPKGEWSQPHISA